MIAFVTRRDRKSLRSFDKIQGMAWFAALEGILA
jgi:hypothetical protein